MPRLPLVDPDNAPDRVREILSTTPLGLLRMVAHAEGAFVAWARYSTALLTRLQLDPLLRELVILQVAHLVGSQYEWSQHVAIARATGASAEQIAAIEAGSDDDPSLTTEQRLVVRFTTEVVRDGTAGEDRVDELAQLLGPRGVVELLLVIGNYMAIARLIATTGLEPEPPVGVIPPPAAPS